MREVGAPPPNPLELLQQPMFGILLRELQREFDRVIVDTPPARHTADARVIAATCRQSVLVGRHGKTEARTMKPARRAAAAHAGVHRRRCAQRVLKRRQSSCAPGVSATARPARWRTSP